MHLGVRNFFLMSKETGIDVTYRNFMPLIRPPISNMLAGTKQLFFFLISAFILDVGWHSKTIVRTTVQQIPNDEINNWKLKI